MNNNINYFDWNEISEIVKNMSQNIKKDYNPEIIISVVRGGMIPGVILSHALNIRKVVNDKIRMYEKWNLKMYKNVQK